MVMDNNHNTLAYSPICWVTVYSHLQSQMSLLISENNRGQSFIFLLFFVHSLTKHRTYSTLPKYISAGYCVITSFRILEDVKESLIAPKCRLKQTASLISLSYCKRHSSFGAKKRGVFPWQQNAYFCRVSYAFVSSSGYTQIKPCY